MQDINLNQLKLKVNDTYKKMKKEQQNLYEAVIEEDVINEEYLDTKVAEVKGRI